MRSGSAGRTACRSVGFSRAAALISSIPVTPLPMAASVKATSTACKPDPGERQQQAVGDEDDGRGSNFAHQHGPCAEREKQSDDADVEQGLRHDRSRVSSRTARAMICVTMAPETWTISHTATSFSHAAGPPACGKSPATISPRARLSTLVRACRRLNSSGKRSSPVVPAAKSAQPAITANDSEDVSGDSHRPPPLRCPPWNGKCCSRNRPRRRPRGWRA